MSIPNAPTERIEWQGRWRTLDRVWMFSPQWGNFAEAWKITNFGRLLFNTIAIAVIGTIGAVSAAVVVAYGFSRFRIPGKTILFTILVGTIILPQQVTIVPTYAMFASIGWVGDVVTTARAALFRQRLQHFLAAAVLHEHSARYG